MKNTLTHIVNYEKRIFDKKKLKMRHDVRHLRKPLNVLRFKKAYGLKISQSIIYEQGYIYMFFSTLKGIIQAQNKTNN